MTAEQKNIKVVVRVRPYNRRELEQNQRCIVKVLDRTTLLFDPDEEDDEFFFQGMKQNYRDITKRVHKKMTMEYDRVFDVDTKNQDIFEECTAPLVDSVLNGYNCSVFVYGATGAGKTFTMLGNENCRGITYLTMKDLFQKIEEQSDLCKFDVGVSYVEVYNEHVMNLLTKSGPMKLREDSNGVVISGLVLKPIYSADELLQMLTHGNANRTQHPTDANSESSRSHAIFQVHIRMTDKKTGTKRTVKLSMIDLAGSERAASTKGIGVRFKEGASINKSLLALGNCINKLADGLKHIPYRDSNLTRILKDSLGGNCQTLMVANVSMSSLTYEDTYNTLKYASRAKNIRTTLRKNELKSNMPKEFYVKKVEQLIQENRSLEEKLALKQKENTVPNGRAIDENDLKMWFSKIDAVYSVVIKTQEYVYGMDSKEKVQKFREKLIEDLENCKRNPEQALTHEDSNRGARFGKRIEKQPEDALRWRKKLQDAHKDLEKLKKEIKSSKYSDILAIYNKGKEFEVQHSKQKIRLDHISRINSAACEFLSTTHENQNSNDHTANPSNTDDACKRICKILYGCGNKPQNEKQEVARTDQDDIDFHIDKEIEIALNGKRLYDKDDDAFDLPSTSKTKSNRKRCNLRYIENDSDYANGITDDSQSDEGASMNSTFKQPKTLRLALPTTNNINSNETQILSTDDEYNTTFNSRSGLPLSDMKLKKDDKVKNKKHLVSNILSEQIVRVRPANKTQQLKNILLKTNISREGILKTVAVGVQKENLKHSPNRVRKSPRPIVSKAIANTTSLTRKNSTRINGGNEPLVRINRAASFRVKK